MCPHRIFITVREKNDKMTVTEKLHIYSMFSSKYEKMGVKSAYQIEVTHMLAATKL